MKDELLKKYKRIKYLKLVSAIMIDLAGNASYLIPVLGESGDLIWGLISGVLIYILFPKRKLIAVGGFVEEYLPGTDFIPTACIAWTLDYVKDNKKTLAEFVSKRVDEEQIVEDILNTYHR